MVNPVFPLKVKKSADVPGMKRISKKRQRRQKIIVFFAVITTICAVALVIKVSPYVSDLITIRREEVYLNTYDEEMREINPDYIGVLKIDGTTIDYPVVRGNDNVKYLHTSFGGDENILGTIFMDYRCIGDYVPHIIIYGHEAAYLNGNKLMFGGLRYFLDEQYREEHPEIMFMENGNLSVFEIFSARLSNINDPAYYLDLGTPENFKAFVERNGAPSDATQIITLATCVGADNDRRMIIQGTLKRVLPVETD